MTVNNSLNTRHSYALLKRYLGPRIARYMLGGRGARARMIEATVLFTDIRDFTYLTATSDPAELYRELNSYYQQVDRVVEQYGGSVNDFGGDSVLAIFGAPFSLPNHAAAALQAGLSLYDALLEHNRERLARRRPKLEVGIGICSGSMMMGDYGSDSRKKFTVIGDCVNVAKRLSDLNKVCPDYAIFVDCNTLEAAGTVARSWRCSPAPSLELKGHPQPLQAHAIDTPQVGELGIWKPLGVG